LSQDSKEPRCQLQQVQTIAPRDSEAAPLSPNLDSFALRDASAWYGFAVLERIEERLVIDRWRRRIRPYAKTVRDCRLVRDVHAVNVTS
jgi:hypothetical protein